MTEDEVIKARSALVVKSNDLIQRSRFSLSAQQQKIILYLISKISPKDEEFHKYKFSIGEFCRVCGLDASNGKNYLELRRAIKELRDRSIWVQLEDGRETLISWISKAYLEPNNGVIEIRLDEDLRPYLLDLKRNFTQFELVYTLHFKSKYSIRLYELLQSIHYNKKESYSKQYTIEDLQKLLDAEKYKDYKNFKARVLLPSLKEINQYSDKAVSFEEIKKGRRVTDIVITVSHKTLEERIEIQAEIERDFDKQRNAAETQLSIFEREEID